VVLGFWAEWNEAGREALERLDRAHRDGGERGPVVIGIHPPGSQPEEITAAIVAMKLGFPTCVDISGGEGSTAWGQLSGRLAVRSVPFAVVVDREGKVAARGRIEDVLDKARELVEKGR
jgi:AhpC/TSA family